MATFFGEVLPIRSRAVEDEEEKDEFIDDVYFSPTLDNTLSCKLLVCSVGPNASLFTELFLLPQSSELVAEVKVRGKQDDDETEKFSGLNYRKISKPSGYVFRDHASSVVYFTCCRILPEQSALIARNLVKSVISSKPTVLILTSCPSSEYNCDDLDHVTVPFLRCLVSSTYPTGTGDRKPPRKYPNCYLCCPLLEQPNTVSGIPAAILTECEMKSISSILIVGYSDQSDIDSNCVRAFLQILRVNDVQNLLAVNPSGEEQLKRKLNQTAINTKSQLYT